MKILILGASGMIGSAMFRVLSENKNWEVFGTLRREDAKSYFSPHLAQRLMTGVDIDKPDALVQVFSNLRLDVVINCIGLTKHHKEASEPDLAIPINALLPHRIAKLAAIAGARFIHVSTDCVFSGLKGAYVEEDFSDACDIYGKTKFLGEVTYPNTVTLRTSTIGHELCSAYGLLEWFLLQEVECTGFDRAIFSGLPSNVFAQVVRDFVIPSTDLTGLYQVGATPISKFELLRLIADIYGKSINIIRDNSFVVDRSFHSRKFHEITGYIAPSWADLVESMHASKQREGHHVR